MNYRYSISTPQFKDLRELIKHVLEHNQFYKHKLGKAGVKKFSNFKNKDDFFQWPLLSKKDLLNDQKQTPPFGLNNTIKPKNALSVHSTSGTTSTPLLMPLSKTDHVRGLSSTIEAFTRLGIKSGDRVYFAMSPGAAQSIVDSLAEMGAFALPWNLYPPYPILLTIKAFMANVLIAAPSHLMSLIEAAKKERFNLKALGLKLIVTVGETPTNKMIRKIESEFSTTCKSHYGAAEMRSYGYTCDNREGEVIYHAVDRTIIFEIINPETGLHDRYGELVVTPLWRHDYPIIRYKTGALVELIEPTCKCGKRGIRFRPKGRVGDDIRLYAAFFHPKQFEAVLQKFSTVTDYKIEVRKRFFSEFILIKVIISTNNKSGLVKEIREEFINSTGIYPVIQVVPSGLHSSSSWKVNRVIDLRNSSTKMTLKDLLWTLITEIYVFLYNRYTGEKIKKIKSLLRRFFFNS